MDIQNSYGHNILKRNMLFKLLEIWLSKSTNAVDYCEKYKSEKGIFSASFYFKLIRGLFEMSSVGGQVLKYDVLAMIGDFGND